jgi:hypothetical protein
MQFETALDALHFKPKPQTKEVQWLPDYAKVGTLEIGDTTYPAIIENPIYQNIETQCANPNVRLGQMLEYWYAYSLISASQKLQIRTIDFYHDDFEFSRYQNGMQSHPNVRISRGQDLNDVKSELRKLSEVRRNKLAASSFDDWRSLIKQSRNEGWMLVLVQLNDENFAFFQKLLKELNDPIRLGISFWVVDRVVGEKEDMRTKVLTFLKETFSNKFCVVDEGNALRLQSIPKPMEKLRLERGIIAGQCDADWMTQLKLRFAENKEKATFNYFIDVPLGEVNSEPYFFQMGESNDCHHAVLCGASGKGKSNFITNFLYQCCLKYSPEKLGLYLFDCKSNATFNGFEKIEHVRYVHKDYKNCALIVEKLKDLCLELHRRIDFFNKLLEEKNLDIKNIYEYYSVLDSKLPVLPIIMIVFDEFELLYIWAKEKDLSQQLISLINILSMTGRSAGISLFVMSQKFSEISSFNDSLGQFSMRISLGNLVRAEYSPLFPDDEDGLILRMGKYLAVIGTQGGMRNHKIVEIPKISAQEAMQKIKEVHPFTGIYQEKMLPILNLEHDSKEKIDSQPFPEDEHALMNEPSQDDPGQTIHSNESPMELNYSKSQGLSNDEEMHILQNTQSKLDKIFDQGIDNV